MSFYKQIVKNIAAADSVGMATYLEQFQKAKKLFLEQLQNQQLPVLAIANDRNDLQEIQDLADKIASSFKKVIVLGVGGSSLGGKTLHAIAKNKKIAIDFFESIDVNSTKNNLEQIDLENTFFAVISKSGETIETICQTLIILEKFKESKIQNFANNLIFITQNHSNSIAKIAKQIGSKIYSHPENIGGRFSYLTIVGLLPAAISGLDLSKIRNGAQKTLENFINEDVSKNNIAQSIVAQISLFDLGFKSSVVMPYIDSLKDFTDWYRQLWAESLGKNGFGSTPINSMGTIDQHSQLQLYLDGPKDKFFTFVTNKNHGTDFKIIDLPNCPTRFGGKNLSEIVKVEQDSTIAVLDQKKLPIRVFEFDGMDEEKLSALMMQMFIETVMIALVKNIDPFGQPAVELRKDLAKEYLG